MKRSRARHYGRVLSLAGALGEIPTMFERSTRTGEKMSRTKNAALTDFERDVTISFLDNALNGYEGDPARANAVQSVVKKLMDLDRAPEQENHETK